VRGFLLLGLWACAQAEAPPPTDPPADAAHEATPEASVPTFPCGTDLSCVIHTEYCSITDYPASGGAPPPPPTFECLAFDAGPTCGGYPPPIPPSTCGCTESDAGAFTVTLCLK
jgi:hypothetical protein